MTVKIDSTTDTPEAVTAALGDLAKEKVEENKSASVAEEIQATDETLESSDDSNENDTQSGDEDDDGDETAKDEGKPKKKNGFKKKIDKLTKRNYEKDREIAYWREIATKSGGQKPAETTLAPTVVDTSAKPKASDFDTHEGYVEALTDWKTDQKFAQREQKERESKLKSEVQEKTQTFQTKMQDFKSAHDDFDDVVSDVDDIQISPAIQTLILESDNGPELMYELAKNRDEYERLCRLSPLAAAREMGKFESKIAKSSDASTQTKTTTKAPPPLKPVNAKASASVKDPDSLPYREWKAWREQQMKKR